MSDLCAWCGGKVPEKRQRWQRGLAFCRKSCSQAWWNAARHVGGVLCRMLPAGALEPLFRTHGETGAARLILERCNAFGAASAIEPERGADG